MYRPVCIVVCVGNFRACVCIGPKEPETNENVLHHKTFSRADCNTRLLPVENGFLVTRINVPNGFRGLGHASALLRECTESADQEHIPLYLTIQPSDGLNYDQLEQFYTRHGFRQVHDNLYQRDPIARTTIPTD